MASVSKWISVQRKPGDSSTTLTLIIKSANRSPAITSTTVVTLPGSTDEKGVAEVIKDAINTQLAEDELLYEGMPGFESTNPYPFLLRARQVDHLIEVWSQAEFQLSASIPGSGPEIIEVRDHPIFLTVKGAECLAPIAGVDLDNWDDNQVSALIAIGSQELIGHLGHNGIATQYIHEFSGKAPKGFNVDRYPMVSWDRPYFRSDLSQTFGGPLHYDVISRIGSVKILHFTRPFNYNPFIDHCDIKMTYVSGITSIHELLKVEAMRLAALIRVPLHISELKGGSGTIKYRNREEVTKDIQARLRGILL